MKPIVISLTTVGRGEELARCTLPDFSLAPAGASAGQPLRQQIVGQVAQLTERVLQLLKDERVETPLSPFQIRLRVSGAIVATEDEAEAVVITIPVRSGPTSPVPSPLLPLPDVPKVSPAEEGDVTEPQETSVLAEAEKPSATSLTADPASRLMTGIFDIIRIDESAEAA